MPDNVSSNKEKAVEDRVRLLPTLSMGIVQVVAVCLLMPFSEYVQNGSRLSFGYMPMGALMPFVCFAVIVNPVLKLINPRLGFTTCEMCIIFIMGFVASIFPTLGLCGFMLAILATPYYFASNENQWNEYITPYIPSWAVPSSEGNVLDWFFNGKPEAESIPWLIWLKPLVWWSLFVGVLFWVAFCCIAILRGQWVEKERLAFPLLEAPSELATQTRDSLVPRIMRRRLFWAGLAVPFLIISWNIVTYFYEDFPRITMIDGARWIPIARGVPWLHLKVNFFVISFAYFTNLDILLSLWLFHFLIMLEVGVFNRVGYTLGPPDLWSNYHAATAWQSAGAFFFLILSGVWIARRHLREVWRKALNPNYPGIDDSKEWISCRTALVGLVLGVTFIAFWFRALGMQWSVVAVYLFAALLMYIGVSKLVAQSGMVYLRAPITAQTFTAYTLGSVNFTPQTLAAMALTFAYCCDFKMDIFASLSHSDKMATSMGTRKRIVFWAIVVAIVLGFVLSTAITIVLAYARGAYNFGAWEFQSGNQTIYNNMVDKIKHPQFTDWRRLKFFGGGAVACAILSALRFRFHWWPLHPLGLAVAGAAPGVFAEFSVFLAWLIKFIILRAGGLHLFEKCKPFFVGMLVGYVLGVTLSFIVDIIWFPGQGHGIHHW